MIKTFFGESWAFFGAWGGGGELLPLKYARYWNPGSFPEDFKNSIVLIDISLRVSCPIMPRENVLASPPDVTTRQNILFEPYCFSFIFKQ